MVNQNDCERPRPLRNKVERRAVLARGDNSTIDVAWAFLAYQQGDSAAIRPLILRFTPVMKAAARSFLSRPDDIEDAVQDAWLAFSRKADRIHTPAAVGGWLKVTAANAALAIAQRSARYQPMSDRFDNLQAPDEELSTHEIDRKAISDALSRLDESERELIRCLFELQLPYSQISARTGRATGGIGPTRRRIVTKLRQDHAIRQLALSRS